MDSKDNNNVLDYTKNIKPKHRVFNEKVTLSPLLDDAPTISEFYANQNIFITGGTGFMGKVLVEKLLRGCPNINTIYLLMRSRKGSTGETRLLDIFNLPLFDKLRNEHPEAFAKLKVINGDISQLNCGISDSDMKFLKNEINIVFHVAASVRFDDSLKKATLINIRGTRELINIAKEMKKLKVFLYTSTTYCNIDKDVIEEKVYKPSISWKTMIDAAENMNEHQLQVLEKKIINCFPNTYTFSKGLVEELVTEECRNIPTVIFRPTIVVFTYKDPVPGWLESYNGPWALFMGVLTGVLHVMIADELRTTDWIPADFAINGIIASAWYKALENSPSNKCLVINASTRDFLPITTEGVKCYGRTYMYTKPYRQVLWYPFVFAVKNRLIYRCLFIFLHVIPAVFLNIILKLNKQPLNLFKLYRRVFVANICLAPFMLNEWVFKNDNYRSLQAILKPNDKEEFSVDYSQAESDQVYLIGLQGIGKYLLHEKETSDEIYAKRVLKLKRLYILHITFVGFMVAAFLFLINLIL